MKVLILGSGGREHALAEQLAKSTEVTKIWCAPGNGGTTQNPKCVNLEKYDHYQELTDFAQDAGIDLVVPGPEIDLINGIEERFRKIGIPCFGPSKLAARMEGSKAFSKDFMSKHNIPTARYANFSDYEQAKKHLLSIDYKVVIKASGLASGKGVLIPENQQEALDALDAIMVKKKFGHSGDEVVIEEFLEGQEISVLALSDGHTVVLLPGAQDHKRIGEGDTGPNTGGMGACAPTPIGSSERMKNSLKSIIQQTIDGMRRDGMPFVGCLFTGFMITAQGPKVLEYNVRFGDPETQTVMGLLSDDTDLAEVFMACCERRLDSVKVAFNDSYSVTVVIASPGYPNKYPTGLKVAIDSAALPKNSFIYHAGTCRENGDVSTSGGRVFAVNGTGETLEIAAKTAYEAVACVQFEGMTYRKDIAHRALKPHPTSSSEPERKQQKNGLTYLDSGVSIDSGNELVARIKPFVKATARLGCDSVIGGFGGLFDLKSVGYSDPVIVSGTDGVGTKLIVAQKAGKHDTVGIDLVAMSVNDLLVQGAEPLFFLDYFACNHLNVDVAVDVVKGIAEGCKKSNCALIGGETAEMPGLYRDDDYDLAGFAVGVVERSLILPRLDEMKAEDVLIGLTSSGFHSNGFSLVRKVIESSGLSYESACPWQPDQKLGVALLEPTRLYTQQLLPILKSEERLIKGLSHITGGGFLENVPRVLPAGLGCEIDAQSYQLPAPFKWVMNQCNIDPLEMCRTFNCGIGMVLIVSKDSLARVISLLESNDPNGLVGIRRIGKVTNQPGVEMKNLESWL
ncbi:hypothetical protein Pst134EA_006962 [Puccinia striiformis f. sp. tritici]|uniref:hypothetical protein n=1 Tax=Puccinia striiformis f. sp. tritici TaxID=168172 RepID=UPI0020086F67|nr:hypothetical protein Pst134EA_006962 [Puccinia striiformis f. sp. tritici]KAH9469681.1 hypothetical protein Pst134EA_006962 [Puccinia striiformis f. sp. tritici]